MVKPWACAILAVVAATKGDLSDTSQPVSLTPAEVITKVGTDVVDAIAKLGWGMFQCFQPHASVITEDFIDRELGGNPYFRRDDMKFPQSQQLLDELRADLVNFSTAEDMVTPDLFELAVSAIGEEVRDLQFAYGNATQVANQMYIATKVDGVFEHVPEKYRGVFWMKGNGVGEELTVVQYGQWFEEDKKLLVPTAPYMWAWPGGTPEGAPFDGVMYDLTGGGAIVLIKDGREDPITYSYNFDEPCPSGKMCEPGSNDLTFSRLQAHGGGDLSKPFVNMKNLFPFLPDVTEHLTGAFHLEEVPGTDGNEFYRRCDWGVGNCHPVEFGSYDLKKIIDGNGHPIQPVYDEFVAYMGDVPLFVWTGLEQPLV